MKKVILLLIIILTIVFIIGVFRNKDNSLTSIQEADTIRIGYSIEAPFSYVTTDGEVTGLSVMEAKEITKRLGIKNTEWRLMEFGSLINELESNKIDVIAAGMYITPQRAKRIRFSLPTFHIMQGLAVPVGNPKNLHSYEQIFALSDLKICALKGSIEESLLLKLGFGSNRLVLTPDIESGIVAVSTGICDALALSSATLPWMNTHYNQKIEVVADFKQPERALKEKLGYGAFGFHKKNIQLQKAWNKELKAFVGSPSHLNLYDAFGFTKQELPGKITIEEIIAQ
ncbi:transporter substrate-binding domain-containing protein [Flavobacterium sp. SM2513]|uniref:transporter substrate-binding domain-containing protein n=1 Tax=Flavobacterium sp. SM2513 TaxID=3424766 RepID=UPI003D7F8113